MGQLRTIDVARLDELRDVLGHLDHTVGPFVYRGQSNESWGLTTSLERVAGSLVKSSPVEVLRKEAETIEEFQRYAHLYVQHLPDKAETLEWLGLMQHFSGPTRMLDFSFSPFVAAYFAMEQATTDFAVWAVSVAAINEYWKKMTPKEHLADSVTWQHRNLKPAVPGVTQFCPKFGNERIRAQRGLFLVAHDGMRSFEENLCEALGVDPIQLGKTRSAERYESVRSEWTRELADVSLLKIRLAQDKKREIERQLDQMNINASTIYPGLDGLGKSLRTIFLY